MSPADAARVGEFAREAAMLATRQKQIAEELDALAGGDAEKLVTRQREHLAERAGDLAHEAATLMNSAADLIPNRPAARQAAQTAANKLQQAQNAVAPAPSADGTTPAPQNAQPQLDAAANSLEQLANQMQPPGPTGPDRATPWTDAYAAANLADDSGNVSLANQAANQAANSLAQAAQQAAQQAKSMNVNAGGGGGGGGGFGTSPDIKEEELRKIGIARADWLRLPGELRDEILQAAADEGPEEYRPLIRRYFRDVAMKGRRTPRWSKRP
jgi:hypothetical protein